MSQQRTPSRGRVFLKRAGLVLATFVVGILLAEVGLRLVLRIQGRPFDAQERRLEMRKMLSPIAQFVPATPGLESLPDGTRRPILHPYYASEELHDTGGVLRHFREDARPDDFEILLLGGSVASKLGIDEEDEIRAYFGALPALRGRRIVFLNAAHAAHKQPQPVNRLTLLLAFGYRPELVVSLDGFNEIALAAENAESLVNPLWPTGPAWRAIVEDYRFARPERLELTLAALELRRSSTALLRVSSRYGLDETALGSQFALWRLAVMGRRRNEIQGELAKDVEPEPDERNLRQMRGADYDPQSVLEISVRGWAECSRSLRALCESRGIAYVHYLQPALFDSGSKPRSEAERSIENPRESWLRGARDGYPKLRAAGEQLAADGERFIDASRAFAEIDETLYVDPCHLTPEGNERLRAFMLERFPRAVVESSALGR